jgi:hypothetical protein
LLSPTAFGIRLEFFKFSLCSCSHWMSKWAGDKPHCG